MTRRILAIWIFLSSVAAALVSASLTSLAQRGYGPEYLRSFGSQAPLASVSFSALLPYAPSTLLAAVVVSFLASAYFWRSDKSSDAKTFSICFIAALNFFLAFFVLMLLVSAYLLLPKLASGA